MKTFLLAQILLTILVIPALSATQGTPAAVQAAIDGASPGATVTIANGSYTWTSGVTCNKAITIQGASPGAVTIKTNNQTFEVFDLTENKDGNMTLANINFETAVASNNYVYVVRTEPWSADTFRGGGRILMHDCKFNQKSWNYSVEWDTNGGVIYNCDFTGGGLNGLSFVCGGMNSSWTQKSTMGMDDTGGLCNTYIEDCRFSKGDTASMNPDDNSRIVVRHCTFDPSSTNGHGLETSQAGARHWEFYDNRWNPCSTDGSYNYNYWMFPRGGTGVITDNYYAAGLWGRGCIGLTVNNTRRHGQVACQTHYPAARQLGQSWKGAGGYSYVDWPEGGTGYYTDPIYLWGNSGPGSQQSNFVYPSQYEPDECGNNQLIGKYIQAGRDYKMEVKPGWQKYPYPHPLRTGGGGPTPTPAPTPTATPVPSPTPTPVPTATPGPTVTPTPTFERWIQQQNDWIRNNPPVPD
jgi:hypothetical protein